MAMTLILLAPFTWQNASFLGVRLNWGGSFQTAAQENQSIGERLLLNHAANEIFTEHGLVGVGLGAFPRALQAKYPQFSLNYQPAHMVLLDVAAELGIFGALFYAITMLAPWLVLWSNRKHVIFSSELLGVIALLLAVSIVGFFDYYTWLLAPGRLWQWLAWGLWGNVYGLSRGNNG
jgi:O-antigen ligase